LIFSVNGSEGLACASHCDRVADIPLLSPLIRRCFLAVTTAVMLLLFLRNDNENNYLL
jgi:hypothetical protein